MKFTLHNLYYQYVIGLLLNVTLLVLLYSCSQTYPNTQLPAGLYKNNIWAATDINDYINSGLNYGQYHVFGIENAPDPLRTIGYPAIIAFYHHVFAAHWLLALQISQCLVFAFIYPVISLLIAALFPAVSNKVIVATFIFLVLSGTYWVRSIMLLTDTIFALLFTAGFYWGIMAFKSNARRYWLLYILFITAAGLIRPTLLLFPLLNFAIAFFVAGSRGIAVRRLLPKIIATTLLFALSCNLATIRNYINYSFLSPSSVVGLNAFRSVAQKVMTNSGETEEYSCLAKTMDTITDITQKTAAREKVMRAAIFKHPAATAQMLVKNLINVCFDNHMVNNLGNYFGYNWKVLNSAASPFVSNYPYKKSALCFYLTYAMMGMYLALWLLLLLFCYKAFAQAQYGYLLLIATLLFVFIFPAIIIGDGGSRLRLPFEPFLVLFAIYQLIQSANGLRHQSLALKTPHSNNPVMRVTKHRHGVEA